MCIVQRLIFVRWEQYSQQDAADCHLMIEQLNGKEDEKPLSKPEDLLFENNQDRRVTTNTETMFRTWEMPHLQNIDLEYESKYQPWQDLQHNEYHANSLFGENTHSHQRERGNVLFLHQF